MYEVQEIPIDLLRDNPYDKRARSGDIQSLAESIKERGLQNPISVIKIEDNFIIVSGHRRTHAFRFLKRKKIPAIIRKESTQTDLTIDLAIENFQRKDLLPAEKGATLEQLFYTIPNVQKNITRIQSLLSQVKLYGKQDNIGEGFTQEDIINAKKFLSLVGMSTTSASLYIRICTLPEDIQKNIVSADNISLVPNGNIVTKSAYELTRITEPSLQRQLYEKATKEKMSHIELKSIVDDLVEKNELARRSNRGSVKRKSEDDLGAAKLTEDLHILSSKVEGFRTRLPIICGRLEKAQWTGSLENMRKACLDMIKSTNDLLCEDMKKEELLECVNASLEVNITSKLRYRFPSRTADLLKVKDGDILLLKVEGIKRSIQGSAQPLIIDERDANKERNNENKKEITV